MLYLRYDTDPFVYLQIDNTWIDIAVTMIRCVICINQFPNIVEKRSKPV
jgi:hypothetical protein